MKKIMSVFLTVFIIFSLFQTTGVFANDNNTDTETAVSVSESSDNIYNKLHFYLDVNEYNIIDNYDELVKATDYAVSEYANKANSRSSTTKIESYQITVEFSSGFTGTVEYKAFEKERETLKSISEIRAFRVRLNNFSKSYHKQLINDNIASLGSIDYESIKHIDYSPFVVLDTKVNNVKLDSLLSLAKCNNVMNISISEECEETQEAPPTEVPIGGGTTSSGNTWAAMLHDINAYDIVTNGTYTGDSIRIGIMEASNICDTTILGLSDKNITIRDQSVATGGHANKVTMIVAQIAPDAEYYVGKKVNGEWLEWYIDNYCDIVNYSGGGSEEGYIDHRDAVIDYQVSVHFITFIKSSGNRGTGDKKITSPGYAYNAITVGGVTTNNTGNIVYHSSSSYLSSSPAVKPNVASKYTITNVLNYGSFSRTSCAAPQVTGCLALLMESNIKYVLYPERIQALIASTARETYDYSETVGFFDEKVGAGILDLERMINSSYEVCVYNESGESHAELASIDVYLNAGDEIQAAISWLIDVTGLENGYVNDASTNLFINDYDLLIYNSRGVTEADSDLLDSNVEMFRFVAPTSGTYTIVIEQWSDLLDANENELIVLCYNIE